MVGGEGGEDGVAGERREGVGDGAGEEMGMKTLGEGGLLLCLSHL